MLAAPFALGGLHKPSGPTTIATAMGEGAVVNRVYVAGMDTDTVSVIGAEPAAVTTVRVGARPFAIALTPDGGTAYVTNLDDDTVSVIDTGKDTVVGEIPVGARPVGIAVAPGGERAYVRTTSVTRFPWSTCVPAG
ncbi:hypothetical protein GCM10027598_74980 [Amycolatopsis oliviviridis]|uniref:Uncharacterized protein n=1 Tax=Amycolatopsis oliviviridis TaxID=1471590 RepID=A0ABQ3L4G3_9PSEU|nr:hypothetical protein [Amycolatopsis oliviviridis]GHH03220.1 hypothetical protein GCM10017790_04920 [Amycolatopsis oliviviridis]